MLTIATAFFLSTKTQAQPKPLSGQNYNNLYLANPALAGITGGIKINAAFSHLKDIATETVATKNLTFDQRLDKNAWGITFTNITGKQRQEGRFSGTYAYHHPLNKKGEYFSFGASVVIFNQHLSIIKTYGYDNNVYTRNFYNHTNYLDGDLGIAYTSDQLNIQTAIPNLISFLKIQNPGPTNISRFYTFINYAYEINLRLSY